VITWAVVSQPSLAPLLLRYLCSYMCKRINTAGSYVSLVNRSLFFSFFFS
jgi:hypothetical protein